jgi:hypothetical protein
MAKRGARNGATDRGGSRAREAIAARRYAADGRGALVTIKEAERWEQLATAAQAELAALDHD